VHSMCNQHDFGSLSFRPTKAGEIKLIKMYPKLVYVVLSVIGRNYLDDMPATMSTIRTRFKQLRELLQRLELMQVMGSDHEILGTRLEVTVQGVDIVQAARRICSELDILRVQSLERLLEGRFDRYLISAIDLREEFRIGVENLKAAMRGIANAIVPPIRVRATLTLARHAIGWSGKFLDRQLREAKAWEEGDRKTRMRRQNANYVYDGCELDDPATRVQVVEFLEHALWCHHPRQRDKSGEPLLLRRCDGRGFWLKVLCLLFSNFFISPSLLHLIA
jgi:hypothetical protein